MSVRKARLGEFPGGTGEQAEEPGEYSSSANA